VTRPAAGPGGFLDADESRAFAIADHENGEHEDPMQNYRACPTCAAILDWEAERERQHRELEGNVWYSRAPSSVYRRR
jgi:hypothetical protein